MFFYTEGKQNSTCLLFIYIYILITVDVRASLRAPRLIPRGLEVNDRVNLQWPWGDSNWWPLGSKPKTGPTKLPLGVYIYIYIYINKYFLLLQLLTTCMSSLLLTHQYHLIVTLSASIGMYSFMHFFLRAFIRFASFSLVLLAKFEIKFLNIRNYLKWIKFWMLLHLEQNQKGILKFLYLRCLIDVS